MQTTTTTTKAKALNSVSFGISHTVDDIHALYRQAENPKNLFSSHFYWIYPSMPFLLKLSEHALPRDTIRARPSSWHYQSTPFLVTLSEHALPRDTIRARPSSWHYQSTPFLVALSEHALSRDTIRARPSSWHYQSTPFLVTLSEHALPRETIRACPSSWNFESTPYLLKLSKHALLLLRLFKTCPSSSDCQNTPFLLRLSKHTFNFETIKAHHSSWNYQWISSWKFFLKSSKHASPLKLSKHAHLSENIKAHRFLLKLSTHILLKVLPGILKAQPSSETINAHPSSWNYLWKDAFPL